MSQPLLTIHTDGASRGNPGPAAFGYVIKNEDGTLIEEGDCLGNMTNNQAEYTALVRALQHALHLGTEHRLEIFSDSELMVKQINGVYRVKKEELKPLYEQARTMLAQFAKATLKHVRREHNSRADALGNEALDGYRTSTFDADAPIEKPAPSSAPTTTLRSKALACLAEAAQTWSEKGLDTLNPEDVLHQLSDLLLEHDVIEDPL